VDVAIREESAAALAEYGRVPIAFTVDRVLDCALAADGLGGIVLAERPVAVPWTKDYDRDAGEAPSRWAARFDVSRWGFLLARRAGEVVGGAVIAVDTPGVRMLEGRRDLAVLWDLRVAPAARGVGVGRALFGAAERWAAARGCRWLKVETQNVNVGACRFYARQGCTLGAIHRFAYPSLPDEVQLLWYKALAPPVG
jgi:ribosomal protein S18 acetylase RimI-like enzyme